MISIIIPILNDNEALIRSINSIAKLNQKKVDLIIVDGSKSSNLNAIKNKTRFSFKYIHAKNSSVYEAMNIGIKNSKGKFLYFMGAGDMIKRFPKIRNSDELICGRVKFKKKNIKQFKILFFIGFFNILHHQSLIYNKKIFLNYLYDTSYKSLSDYNLNIILIKNSYKIRFLNDFLISEIKPHGLSSNYFLSIKEGVKILYSNKFYFYIIFYILITTLSTIKNKLILRF